MLGTFLFSFAAGIPFGFFMATLATGNTLAALGCTFLLKRVFKFENAHERLRDVTVYLLVAGVLGATINATTNAAGLIWEHKFSWSLLYPNLLAWWVPNLLAVLMWTPGFTVWTAPSLWRWNFRQAMEALVCVTGLATSTLVSFSAWYIYGIHSYLLAYLPVPFLLWGTFRGGPRGAVTGTLVVAGMVFYYLVQERRLANATPDRLQLIGGYICIMAMVNLLLAAMVAERRRAELDLEENEKRLRTVVADQSDLICRFQPEGRITFVNPAFCDILRAAGSTVTRHRFLPDASRRPRRQLCAKSWPGCQTDRPGWSFDRRAVAADDHVEWQQCNLRRLEAAANSTDEFQAVMQDITPRKNAEMAAKEAKATLEKMNRSSRPPPPRPTPPPSRPTAPTTPRANFSPT